MRPHNFGVLATASLLSGLVSANNGPLVSNADTSLRFLYQNNLNFTDDVNHIGSILLDPMTNDQASQACSNLNEGLLSIAAIQDHESDFISLLGYEAYAGRVDSDQCYLVANGTIQFTNSSGTGSITYKPNEYLDESLPVLCTQTSKGNKPNATATTQNLVTVSSNDNTYVGFRNQKSFRFQGIPFADTPERFEYSSLYSQTGQTLNATVYGPTCKQGGQPLSSEDCLFLNIQTPYIPKAGDTSNLRPVYFWIHGGGFTGGSAQDAGADGGQMTSREDVVVVQIQYRLSTLGFLAVPGTNLTGNWGIGDQITALDWIRANVASFGGDKDKITIGGASAGAGSVRTLLGSPEAIGKFHGSIAASNLGGGTTLGIGPEGDYATTYSSYLTIEESFARAGEQILNGTNCLDGSLDDQIACLKTANATTIINLPTVARYVVQDGTFVNTEQLIVTSNNGSAANIHTMWGILADDGGSFATYPTDPNTNLSAALQVGLGIDAANAQSIIDSGLFPYYDTGNATLDAFNVTDRVSTDLQFRCVDQATIYTGVQSGAFKSSYFYQIQRANGGYNPELVPANGPVEPGYPNGNPNEPYFKLHGNDQVTFFGVLDTIRDENDLVYAQLGAGYVGNFIRSSSPNARAAYLAVRGYTDQIAAVAASGPWDPVTSSDGPLKLLDATSLTAPFQDQEQCNFLGLGTDYYINGGS